MVEWPDDKRIERIGQNGGEGSHYHHLHKHGHRPKGGRSPTYVSWDAMKTRCRCVRSDSYPFYGGRGIKVCERWMDFVNFLADMGNRPEGCTLDRVDSKGDYEPGNCRWATIREQSLNRANVHTVEFKGEELTLSEISKKYGVPKTTVYRRWKQGVRDDALICRVNRNKGR